jgi:hypothetical protein
LSPFYAYPLLPKGKLAKIHYLTCPTSRYRPLPPLEQAFSREWVRKHHDGAAVLEPEKLARDYWNMVETGNTKVAVEYANDIDTASYWSGFPKVRVVFTKLFTHFLLLFPSCSVHIFLFHFKTICTVVLF